ncbi:hypothetical protein [Taibaiella chishuiensis]|uniref:Lipoprotein n=1 Tax=Taibaiella chishuiensis TaxID=1434707 RepID=A0A2P8CST6_9BACT|nr:hypothetical protein [Taibaiella chishuiensis]PSK88031.1 hypothetical protein B0I18_11662 [Taibaiella chishuiensis]
MKKAILSCGLLAVSIAFLAGCGIAKEKTKADVVKNCLLSVPAGIPKDVAEDYCNCSADKLLEKYSAIEIMKMEEKLRNGDETPKAEMMKTIQPCIDDLTRKAKEHQQGH